MCRVLIARVCRRGRGVVAGVRVGPRGAVSAVGRAVPRLHGAAARVRRARRGAGRLPASAAPALPQQAARAPAPERGNSHYTTLHLLLHRGLFIDGTTGF